MINRQVRIWRGCQTALVLPLALLSWGAPAADDNYVPPVSLDSVESLMEQPRDNGYGIGSLIAAQQANDGAASSPSTAGMTKGDLTGGHVLLVNHALRRPERPDGLLKLAVR
ncbi:hypothetical protein GGER_16230 [Serratia rubidaea]